MPLAEWVSQELDGYVADTSALPPYRGPFNIPILGHFLGPFRSELRDIPIPPMTFPEEIRDGQLIKTWIINPIAEIQDLADIDGEAGRFHWPADAVEYYNSGVQNGKIRRITQPGMVLANATRPIPRQLFVGIIDAVRNRALDLALEVERVAPDAGEPGAPSDSDDQAKRVVNDFNFYGNVSNVAIDSSHVNQIAPFPTLGDEASLIRYLGAAGVSPQDLIELQNALADDRSESNDSSTSGPGTRVREWISRVSTDLATNAVGGVIAAAVMAYFGR